MLDEKVRSGCNNNNEYLYTAFNKIKVLHRNLEPKQKLNRIRKEESFIEFLKCLYGRRISDKYRECNPFPGASYGFPFLCKAENKPG